VLCLSCTSGTNSHSCGCVPAAPTVWYLVASWVLMLSFVLCVDAGAAEMLRCCSHKVLRCTPLLHATVHQPAADGVVLMPPWRDMSWLRHVTAVRWHEECVLAFCGVCMGCACVCKQVPSSVLVQHLVRIRGCVLLLLCSEVHPSNAYKGFVTKCTCVHMLAVRLRARALIP
jgi:hypothetical protein